jgi:photosystem II stability/assembly factor-like uncharacterized protein
MQSILVGTIDGIFRCHEQNRSWMVKQKSLDGQEVPCIAVQPDNRNHVYAGTRAGGLFKSLDGGGEWEKIGAETLRGKIRCLAIDPAHPATMYIGTEPAGLLISDDEGRSWREAPGVREIAQNRKWTYPVPTIEPHVRWIALAPKTKRTLLAAQVGGIVYSDDAGASWRDLRDPFDMDVHSIVIDPFDTQRVYAATGGGERSPYPKGKPLYRSNDGGQSWMSITDSLERHYAVPVKLDPTDSQTLYLGVARGTPLGWRGRPSVADGAIMRSRDSGKTWEQLAEGLPNPLLSMVECIEFDPDDAETIVMATGGEGARYVNLEKSELFRSSNRGEHWHQIVGDLPNICSLCLQ